MRLVLRTDQVQHDERVDYWRSAMRTGLDADCLIEPAARTPFSASMCVMPCGPLTLVEMSGNAYRATRRGAGRDGWVSIKVQLDGLAVVDDRQRSARLTPGDVCLVPPDREIVADRAGPFRQVLVNVPTHTLDERVPTWRERQTLTLESTRAHARPAAELLRYVFDHHQALDAGSRECLAGTAWQLLAGLLNGLPQATAAVRPAPRSRMAEFQRQRVERFILEHLRDPELSVDKIACELGLSKRYVHKLFEGEPLNVMQWALAERLHACRQDIARRGGRSVGEVAYGWGFNSLSHFSRVFKKQFGLRPTQV